MRLLKKENYFFFNKSIIICFTISVIYSIYRSLNPFEEDQKVFFAIANFIEQSDKQFPFNILSTFDLKPFLSRSIIYTFAKISNLFNISIQEPYKYIFFNQILLCLLVIFTSFSFAKSFVDSTSLKNKFKPSVYLFTFVTLLSIGSESFMQVDHLALIFSILCLAFFLRESHFELFFASLLLPIIISIKGISLLYVFSILSITIFLEKINKRKIIYFLFGFILGLVILIFSLPELTNASLMQSRNINLFGLIKNLFFYKHGIFTFIDLIPIPLISLSIIYLITNKKLSLDDFSFISIKKSLMNLTFQKLIKLICFFSFLTASIFIAILQVGFSYHYISYIFFLFITLLYLVSSQKEIINKLIYFLISSMVFFYSFFWGGIAFFIGKYLPVINNFSSKNKITFDAERKVFMEIDSEVKGDSLLFLTSGEANFYLSNYKSPCYEFYPLSIQRLISSSQDKKNKSYFYKTLDCINSFDGNYILIQTNWLPKNKYQIIYPDPKKYEYLNSYDARQRKYSLYKKIIN